MSAEYHRFLGAARQEGLYRLWESEELLHCCEDQGMPISGCSSMDGLGLPSMAVYSHSLCQMGSREGTFRDMTQEPHPITELTVV